MKPINGIIKNAMFFDNDIMEPRRSPCIKGNVYLDTKGRFHDGERITTSRIVAMYQGAGSLVVETTFSAYFVEFAPEVAS